MKNQNVDLVKRALDSNISVEQRKEAIRQIKCLTSLEDILYETKNETTRKDTLVQIIVFGHTEKISIDDILTKFISSKQSDLLKRAALQFVGNTMFLKEFALLTNNPDLKKLAQERVMDLDIKCSIFGSKINGKLKYGTLSSVLLKSTLLQIMLLKGCEPISNRILMQIFSLQLLDNEDDKFLNELIEELFYQPINVALRVNIFNFSNRGYKFNSSKKEFLKLDSEFKEAILPFISMYPEFTEEVALYDEDDEIRKKYIPFVTRGYKLKELISNENSSEIAKTAELVLETEKLF